MPNRFFKCRTDGRIQFYKIHVDKYESHAAIHRDGDLPARYNLDTTHWIKDGLHHRIGSPAIVSEHLDTYVEYGKLS